MTGFHRRGTLLLVLLAAFAADAGPAASPPLGPALAGFARLLGGSWRVTFQSGERQFDTWQIGPGGHSVRRVTRGADAAGSPWRALEVLYWHPGRQEVRLFALDPYGQGVMEGAIAIEGERAEAVFEVHQPGQTREMRRTWAFRGADAFRSTLWERTPETAMVPIPRWDSGSVAPGDAAPAAVPLAEWDYQRVRNPSHYGAEPGNPAPGLPVHFSAFEALLKRSWQSQGFGTDGATSSIRTSFEWVPYAEYLRVLSLAPEGEGGPAHQFDAYVYRHPATGRLQVFALTESGGIYRGQLDVLEDGEFQLALTGHEGGREHSHDVRIEFAPDGRLRYEAKPGSE